MIIAIIDVQNDCSFAIKFANEAERERVEDYMQEGLRAWFCAAHDPVDYNGKYWKNEDVERFYGAGYVEPTEELLNEAGIEFELVDIEYDEDENISNADGVIYY